MAASAFAFAGTCCGSRRSASRQVAFAMPWQLAVFGDAPGATTLAGAALIAGGTLVTAGTRDKTAVGERN